MAAGQVLFRSPALTRRPSGLLIEADGTRRSVGEVAGGTAAECAAMACCCPCAVVELVVLAFYKVPAELCKKAWRKNKWRRLARRRKALLMPGPAGRDLSPLAAATTTASVFDEESDMATVRNDVAAEASVNSRQVDETWPELHRTGFWRSPSRDD